MHSPPFVVMAEIAIPDARHCLTWAAPILVLAAAICVIGRMDQIIDRLFPHWDWERRLGWLNLGAHRRAERILRWIGYFIYAVLGLALLGIVWAAQGLVAVDDWDDPHGLLEVVRHVSVLLACLGLWLLYLGCELLPKMRGQYEEEELEKFRAEQEEIEREHAPNPTSRVKSPLPQATARIRPWLPNRNSSQVAAKRSRQRKAVVPSSLSWAEVSIRPSAFPLQPPRSQNSSVGDLPFMFLHSKLPFALLPHHTTPAQ